MKKLLKKAQGLKRSYASRNLVPGNLRSLRDQVQKFQGLSQEPTSIQAIDSMPERESILKPFAMKASR